MNKEIAGKRVGGRWVLVRGIVQMHRVKRYNKRVRANAEERI